MGESEEGQKVRREEEDRLLIERENGEKGGGSCRRELGGAHRPCAQLIFAF